jgi:hypothetical protein
MNLLNAAPDFDNVRAEDRAIIESWAPVVLRDTGVWVRSDAKPTEGYLVALKGGVFCSCSCPDHRERRCKAREKQIALGHAPTVDLRCKHGQRAELAGWWWERICQLLASGAKPDAIEKGWARLRAAHPAGREGLVAAMMEAREKARQGRARAAA